jgi:RNA polymerase sigma-70 factor, ECF subfamily
MQLLDKDNAVNETGNGQALVAGLRRGDAEAQGQLLSLYGEPLVRFLVAICHVDPVEAEDIAVEALYRAIDRIDSFVGRPDAGLHGFRNWLFTIARNLWRDRLRRQKRIAEAIGSEQGSLVIGQPDDESESDSSAAQAVREALSVLPEPQRQTLVLHYGGSELQQVAEILGVPPGTVRQWKRRGIAALAEALRDHPALAYLSTDNTSIVGETE